MRNSIQSTNGFPAIATRTLQIHYFGVFRSSFPSVKYRYSVCQKLIEILIGPDIPVRKTVDIDEGFGSDQESEPELLGDQNLLPRRGDSVYKGLFTLHHSMVHISLCFTAVLYDYRNSSVNGTRHSEGGGDLRFHIAQTLFYGVNEQVQPNIVRFRQYAVYSSGHFEMYQDGYPSIVWPDSQMDLWTLNPSRVLRSSSILCNLKPLWQHWQTPLVLSHSVDLKNIGEHHQLRPSLIQDQRSKSTHLNQITHQTESDSEEISQKLPAVQTSHLLYSQAPFQVRLALSPTCLDRRWLKRFGRYKLANLD